MSNNLSDAEKTVLTLIILAGGEINTEHLLMVDFDIRKSTYHIDIVEVVHNLHDKGYIDIPKDWRETPSSETEVVLCDEA